MAEKKTTIAGESPPVTKFSKEQILKSTRYEERRDLLTALLKNGKTYSHADVERMIDDFMKG